MSEDKMLQVLFIHLQDPVVETSFPACPFSRPFVNTAGLGGDTAGRGEQGLSLGRGVISGTGFLAQI